MEPKFVTRTTLDLEDYKRYIKTMQGSRNRKRQYATTAVVTLWILFVAIMNINGGKVGIGVFIAAVAILWPLFRYYMGNRQFARVFAQIRDSGGSRFDVFFFDDYLETKTRDGGGRYEYKDLQNVVETEKDFYIEPEEGLCLIVQKKNCSEELLSFIKELAGKHSAG